MSDEAKKPDDHKDQDHEDSDIGRDPGSGGFFVPPLWLGKIVKLARGR